MKKILFVIASIIYISLQCRVYAYDLEIDGLYYNITSIKDLTVEVTKGGTEYTGDIIIPDNIEYNGTTLSVTSIGEYVFHKALIKRVKIGDNVKTIGDLAFFYSTLEQVEMGKSIESIGWSAFGNTLIKEINIPASVTLLSCSAFSTCLNLTKVVIEDGPGEIKSDRDGAMHFGGCPIEEFYLGRNMNMYPNGNYSGSGPLLYLANTSKIEIGPCVTTIDFNLFRNAPIKEIVIPSNVNSIWKGAFSGCSKLEKVVFEDGENKLWGDFETSAKIDSLYLGRNFKGYSGDKNPFGNTSVRNLNIGNKVTELPEIHSPELETLSLPSNVEIINSLSGCNLTNIYCYNLFPPLIDADDYFDNSVYVKCVLHVPEESLNLYQKVRGWKNFFTIKTMPKSGINDIINYENNFIEVYNMQGVKLDVKNRNEMSKLQRGIYIINGKKEFVK